ncbi:MAG: HlyD family efflux transporter periplasmic adaptor subunit [Phormidesmis sp. RL_2_1]|nr:HlyD family efflux transporter periplasmic adaptor subunit [Phormidesmis sp. RL_2_1]
MPQLRRRSSDGAVDGVIAPEVPVGNASKRQRLHVPRWLIYALVGSTVVTLVAIAFRPAPLAVDVGQITQGPIQVTIDAEGKTQVQERYVVAAPVAGRLQRITLDVGDAVVAGTPIAQLDPLPLNTQVSTAQARLQQLQAELAGVDTQRPKSQEMRQAEASLQAAMAENQAVAATVTEAKAALEQAQRDRQRAEALESAGAITRQQKEAAELNETRQAQALKTAQQHLERAIANVAAARAEIPRLRAEQSDPDYLLSAYEAQIAGVEAELANLADEAAQTTISAPVSGTVLNVSEASARFVQAGEPLLEIGDAANLELVIDVLSADAVKIKPGDPILVEQWGGLETLTAVVNYIEPAAFTKVSALGVEEQRVNVIGRFQASDGPTSDLKSLETSLEKSLETSLGDGYRIEARIVIWANENALQVPVSALYRCEDTWCVFRVKNGQAEPRKITIGPRNSTMAAVESGLKAGETVILHPSEQVESGRKVEANQKAKR